MPPLYAARLTTNATGWRPIKMNSRQGGGHLSGEFGWEGADWTGCSETNGSSTAGTFGFVQGVNSSRKLREQR